MVEILPAQSIPQAPYRTLTDADVDAIAARLESRISDRFVQGAGMGVLRLAWRGLLTAIVLLAIYAFVHGGKP